MLRIVIPVKQSWVKPDCFIRLWINLLRLSRSKLHKKKLQILIVDCSYSLIKPIIFCITKFFSAQYLSIEGTWNGVYSPALVKNLAVREILKDSNARSVFFLDVDVLLMDSNIDMLVEMTQENTDFYWFAVDFLNQEYQLRKMLNFARNPNANRLDLKNVIQTGYVTGAQFFSLDFFKKIGGYNERFYGYGCEDIEMIHRATLILGLRKPIVLGDVYYTDDRGYNPEHLVGFRNFYFNYKQCKDDRFLQFDNPKHFYHSRKNRSKYLKKREVNDRLMLDIMQEFDKSYEKIWTC